ncbi:ABC-F family ATP-binding cassette domain-containing protein [Martelella limonii]|uniref:ABC-F family ATP-binding cassette domain-containing protein n=1 Tax=Martelella limonii TaxID=1647649 RepID=UPI001580F199|nr:ABC-F family ATP-binding cassette domain-containing protein [Martelella limonii]
MPITLSALTFITPDGQLLFDNLSAVFGPERTGLVGRNGAGKSTLLRLIAGKLRPTSGSIHVSGRLGIFDQVVRPAPGETIAGLFGIEAMLAAIARAEQGLANAEDLAEIDWAVEERALRALAATGLSAGLDTPLERLSGGETTRARLARLIFDAPGFILLDEPSNNLDREGRAALGQFLASWRGGALVVSHDRTLLEGMDAIAALSGRGLRRYGGNYSFYEAERRAEQGVLAHDLQHAEKVASEARQDARRRAERQARHDASGRRLRDSGSLSKMKLDSMKEHAEASDGRNQQLSDRQARAASEALDAVRKRVEIEMPFSVQLSPSGLQRQRRVARADALSAGYPPAPLLFSDLSFEIVGPERTAVDGQNGAGKSTLIAILTGRHEAVSGSAEIYVSWALFDQALSLLDPQASVRDNFRRLNPAEDENGARAALARFRFRADEALRRVADLSGGERLRAGLAVAIGGKSPVELLILDEPTNHLDLESLQALEQGLNAYDGALLVVSHDGSFLERIGITRRIGLGRRGGIA